MRTVANKFKYVKFVKIRADAAIPNYPDKNLPTLLIYKKGDIAGQFVTLKLLGGEGVSAADIEWQLKKLKIVDSDLTTDPRTSKGKLDEDDEEEETDNKARAYLRRAEDDTYDLS